MKIELPPNCEGERPGENTGTTADGVKICCDARKYANTKTGEQCPFLRLVDIGHVHCPVCIYGEDGIKP